MAAMCRFHSARALSNAPLQTAGRGMRGVGQLDPCVGPEAAVPADPSGPDEKDVAHLDLDPLVVERRHEVRRSRWRSGRPDRWVGPPTPANGPRRPERHVRRCRGGPSGGCRGPRRRRRCSGRRRDASCGGSRPTGSSSACSNPRARHRGRAVKSWTTCSKADRENSGGLGRLQVEVQVEDRPPDGAGHPGDHPLRCQEVEAARTCPRSPRGPTRTLVAPRERPGARRRRAAGRWPRPESRACRRVRGERVPSVHVPTDRHEGVS